MLTRPTQPLNAQVPNYALQRGQMEHTVMVSVRAAAFWLKPSSSTRALVLCRDAPNFVPALAKAMMNARAAFLVLVGRAGGGDL